MSAKKNSIVTSNDDLFPTKVSLEVMRSIWDDKDRVYTDEQLLKLREFVYILVECIFKATKQAKENCNSHLS